MKNRITKLVGTAMILATILFSVEQLNATAVIAASGECAPGSQINCGNCTHISTTVWVENDQWVTECRYVCYCPGPGGGEPMYIEQTFTHYDPM